MTSDLITTILVSLGISVAGAYILSLYLGKDGGDGIPLTRRQREDGGWTFTESSVYSRYRNQVRAVRRHFGWPSGRQWKRLYRSYPWASFIRSLRAGNSQPA